MFSGSWPEDDLRFFSDFSTESQQHDCHRNNASLHWVPSTCQLPDRQFFSFFILTLQTASCGPLQAKGFVPSAHSERGDLSCHCSWLNDCIFEQRTNTPWSFRALPNSRFVSSTGFSSRGYYCLMRLFHANKSYYEWKGVSIGMLSLQWVMCISVHHHKACFRTRERGQKKRRTSCCIWVVMGVIHIGPWGMCLCIVIKCKDRGFCHFSVCFIYLLSLYAMKWTHEEKSKCWSAISALI